jgi:RNA polymerase sigma-70 factor, ECF subfamily
VNSQADSRTLDLDLVSRAQQGDADAFASLFHKYRPKMFSVCLRMTNNPAEAEDLTQDIFLRVFRKIATFRKDSALSSWLYRVAVNTVLMHFRKHVPPQIPLEDCSNPHAGFKHRKYGKVDDGVVSCLDRIVLARAISELPTGYRMIYRLHEIEGYHHEEIARLLVCSCGNSKSQLHRAKLRMKHMLSTHTHTTTGPRSARIKHA